MKAELDAGVPIEIINQAQAALVESIKSDPKYSLEPDPTGALGIKPTLKQFIKAYIEYRNIPIAAQIAGIEEIKAQRLMFDPVCAAEIRRINLAISCRRFSKRLLTIDELGGYLTSVLLDDDISACDRLDSKDKLQAVKLAIELNKLKAEGFKNPAKIIEYVDIESDVKNMDANDIRRLINDINSPDTKKDLETRARREALLAELSSGHTSPAEFEYFKTCPLSELEEKVQNVKKFKEQVPAENLSGQSNKETKHRN